MSETASQRLFLVRHARPSAGWGGVDSDPGLDEFGRMQASAAAERLLAIPPAYRPHRVVSSPLRRCQETAKPLAVALGVDVEIDPAVGEIPTPASLAPQDRPLWLQSAMAGRWCDIAGDIDYEAWRDQVAKAVSSYGGAAVFSHFVAINAVLSVISGNNQVISFRPDHASISTLAIGETGLRLILRGPEAITGIA